MAVPSLLHELDLPEVVPALARFVRDARLARATIRAGARTVAWPAARPPFAPAAERVVRAALASGRVHGLALEDGTRALAAAATGPVPALVVAETGAARRARAGDELAAFCAGPLREALDAWAARDPFAALEASSPSLAGPLADARRIAPTTLPVLILGETGTGKELVARAIHDASGRRGRLVAENCAAFPDALLEAELFGVRRGAFTGADRDRAGRVAEAEGGTLFLDEVGDLAPPLQAKVLRLLQENEVRALGADRARRVDVRVVAATHRALHGAGGGFRSDLYYRLAGAVIRLPPLRARRDDLPFLVAALLARIAREGLGRGRVLGPRGLDALGAGALHGNVRELDNRLRRAAVLAPESVIDERLLRAEQPPPREGMDLERRAIRDALDLARGSKADAARRLGWSRQRLYRRLASLGLLDAR